MTILIQQGFVSTEFYLKFITISLVSQQYVIQIFFLFQENVDVKYMHNKLTVQNTVHISILSCSKIYIYMTD